MIEIPEDAYQFTPCGQLGGRIAVGSAHEHVGEFSEMEDALAAVKAKMDKEQFWPSLVWVSDHGNWWYIDQEGNEIKVEYPSCEHCGEDYEEDTDEDHPGYCSEDCQDADTDEEE